MTERQRKRLVNDYIRARTAYYEAVEEGRREYDELVAAGLIEVDHERSE